MAGLLSGIQNLEGVGQETGIIVLSGPNTSHLPAVLPGATSNPVRLIDLFHLSCPSESHGEL